MYIHEHPYVGEYMEYVVDVRKFQKLGSCQNDQDKQNRPEEVVRSWCPLFGILTTILRIIKPW